MVTVGPPRVHSRLVSPLHPRAHPRLRITILRRCVYARKLIKLYTRQRNRYSYNEGDRNWEGGRRQKNVRQSHARAKITVHSARFVRKGTLKSDKVFKKHIFFASGILRARSTAQTDYPENRMLERQHERGACLLRYSSQPQVFAIPSPDMGILSMHT